jgi:hypothetical protein
MPFSLPLLPKSLIDVTVFLPDILAIAVSEIISPASDVDFLVFDECLFADAVLYVFDLLAFVNGVAFLTTYF